MLKMSVYTISEVVQQYFSRLEGFARIFEKNVRQQALDAFLRENPLKKTDRDFVSYLNKISLMKYKDEGTIKGLLFRLIYITEVPFRFSALLEPLSLSNQRKGFLAAIRLLAKKIKSYPDSAEELKDHWVDIEQNRDIFFNQLVAIIEYHQIEIEKHLKNLEKITKPSESDILLTLGTIEMDMSILHQFIKWSILLNQSDKAKEILEKSQALFKWFDECNQDIWKSCFSDQYEEKKKKLKAKFEKVNKLLAYIVDPKIGAAVDAVVKLATQWNGKNIYRPKERIVDGEDAQHYAEQLKKYMPEPHMLVWEAAEKLRMTSQLIEKLIIKRIQKREHAQLIIKSYQAWIGYFESRNEVYGVMIFEALNRFREKFITKLTNEGMSLLTESSSENFNSMVLEPRKSKNGKRANKRKGIAKLNEKLKELASNKAQNTSPPRAIDDQEKLSEPSTSTQMLNESDEQDEVAESLSETVEESTLTKMGKNKRKKLQRQGKHEKRVRLRGKKKGAQEPVNVVVEPVIVVEPVEVFESAVVPESVVGHEPIKVAIEPIIIVEPVVVIEPNEQTEVGLLVEQFEKIELVERAKQKAPEIDATIVFSLLKKKHDNKVMLTQDEESLIQEQVRRLKDHRFIDVCNALTDFMIKEPRLPKIADLIHYKIINTIFSTLPSNFKERYYSSSLETEKLRRFMSVNLSQLGARNSHWIVYFTVLVLDELQEHLPLETAIELTMTGILAPYEEKNLISKEESFEIKKETRELYRRNFSPSPYFVSPQLFVPVVPLVYGYPNYPNHHSQNHGQNRSKNDRKKRKILPP